MTENFGSSSAPTPSRVVAEAAAREPVGFGTFGPGAFGHRPVRPTIRSPQSSLARLAVLKTLRTASCSRWIGFCLLALLAGNARAQLIQTDAFDYPDGPVVGAEGSPWVVNYAAETQTQILAGRLHLTQSEGESVRLDLPANLNTGTVFARFEATFTELPTGNGNYFAFFRQAGVDNLRGRLWVSTNGAAPGKFRLGCLTITGVPTMIPADLSLHTPYTLVLRYNITNYTTTLWINPAHEDDTARRADNTYLEGSMSHSVGHFGFKQVAGYEAKAHGMGSLYVDNLAIGRNFYDVWNRPHITSITRLPNHLVHLTAVGIPSTNYLILASTNLATTNWTVLGSQPAAVDGSFDFTDVAAPGHSARFYQLLTQ
ncbi:MAG: hypothetical protein KIS67_19710 [Verrucomicrobiae bacterium]|nr:hypothetical protein [Verrucomicrobiae bacterium]